MTNKEILQADLLDILFEHRNKSYGAYTLRRYYNNRLLVSLGLALSLTSLFFLIFLIGPDTLEKGKLTDSQFVLTICNLPIEPVVEKKEPPPVMKAKVVATVNATPPVIVPDIAVTDPLPEINQIAVSAISDETNDGVEPEDLNKGVEKTMQPATGNGGKAKETKEFVPFEKIPSFPGGPAALALFFSKTLSAPGDLEPGEKKIIMVRFIVGADGTITKTEITQSAGDSYDREVLRAFKRMPKWDPAIQNGVNVATTFTQPVTFVGQQE